MVLLLHLHLWWYYYHHNGDDDDGDGGEPVEAENNISEAFVLGRTTARCLHLVPLLVMLMMLMARVSMVIFSKMIMMMRMGLVTPVKDLTGEEGRCLLSILSRNPPATALACLNKNNSASIVILKSKVDKNDVKGGAGQGNVLGDERFSQIWGQIERKTQHLCGFHCAQCASYKWGFYYYTWSVYLNMIFVIFKSWVCVLSEEIGTLILRPIGQNQTIQERQYWQY